MRILVPPGTGTAVTIAHISSTVLVGALGNLGIRRRLQLPFGRRYQPGGLLYKPHLKLPVETRRISVTMPRTCYSSSPTKLTLKPPHHPPPLRHPLSASPEQASAQHNTLHSTTHPFLTLTACTATTAHSPLCARVPVWYSKNVRRDYGCSICSVTAPGGSSRAARGGKREGMH